MNNDYLYYKDDIRPKSKMIFWSLLFSLFPLLALLFFENIKNIIILFGLISLQIFLLSLMLYIYNNFLQVLFKNMLLPIVIHKFEKINLAFSFREPMFDSINTNIQFKFFFNNDYFEDSTDNLKYDIQLLNDIKEYINNIWKIHLINKGLYFPYLKRLFAYCFIFGIIILLTIAISTNIFPLTGLCKNIYIILSIISLSYWLYFSIILMTTETAHNLNLKITRYGLTSFENVPTIMNKPSSEKTLKQLEWIINISSTVVYAVFVGMLSVIIN